jgi:hypothetical protein
LGEHFSVGGGALKIKKGAYFIMEQQRFDDEVWLPSFADTSVSVLILLVARLKINQSSKYSNYQKFDAEVKESQVRKP